MNFAKRNAWWLAPLIAFFGFVTYYVVSAQFPVLRNSALLNLVLVAVGAILALLGLVSAWKAASWRGKSLHLVGTLVSGFFAGVLFWYVFDLSYQLPGASEKTSSLETAPDFSLPSATGETVSLESLRGEKVILSFYRGFW